jgi:hypothetical protein
VVRGEPFTDNDVDVAGLTVTSDVARKDGVLEGYRVCLGLGEVGGSLEVASRPSIAFKNFVNVSTPVEDLVRVSSNDGRLTRQGKIWRVNSSSNGNAR